MTLPRDDSTLEQALRAALAPAYQLLGRVGAGGMGTVFLARDPALRRDVAVKVLSPQMAQDPEAFARFEREAQAVAALAHPNVVAIFGLGAVRDGTPYFLMQYVAGQSLADRIASEGPVSVAEARRMLGEVASALAAAHAKGIIHRDIKPANVLHESASGRVLVGDFGLAAVGGAPERTAAPDPVPDWNGVDLRLTQAGMRVGTPEYMAPEQLVMEDVTEKTDVYALGLLAYELLLGRGPFEAKTPGELIAAHLRDTPVPLARLRADVDAELSALVASCLEKEAAARPTAADLARRLAPSGEALLEWPPPGLDALRGDLTRIGRQVGWASSALSLSFAVLIGLGDMMTDVSRTPLGTTALLMVVLGALGLAVRTRVLLRDAGLAAAAVRAGFTWRTLLEVGADRRGDSGALIAGRGRFARASASQRDAMRRLRIGAALVEMGAPLAAPLLLVVLLVLAARGDVAPNTAGALAMLPLLLQLFARALPPLVEQAIVGADRRPAVGRERPAVLRGLAERWYEAFDAARGASAFGRGRAGGAQWGRLVGAAALVFAVVAGLLLSPFALVTVRGPIVADLVTGFGFGSAITRYRSAAPMEAYAPDPDPSVSAEAAGRAAWDIAMLLSPIPPDKTPPAAIPERRIEARQALPALRDGGLFATMRDARTGYPAAGPLFAQARRGFSVDERRWLTEVAQHPVWRPVAIVSRASSADLLGGRFVTPLPADLEYYRMPIPRTQHHLHLVAANTARAALAYSLGRRDEAETMLREILGYGRILATSTYLVDVSSGAIVLERGREALEAFYAVADPARREELRGLLDEIAAAERGAAPSDANVRAGPSGSANQRRDRLAALRRPGMHRAMRFEQMATLSTLQCSTLREVVFGPSPELLRAAEFLRDSVARYDTERAVVAAMLRIPESGADEGWVPDGPPSQMAGRMLAFTGSVLGSRRIEGCARWLGNFSATP